MTKNKSAQWNRDDRDLLVELRTEMIGVRADIKDLKDNFSARLAVLEAQKMEKLDAEKLFGNIGQGFSDSEKRLRKLEVGYARIMTWGSAALLVLGIAEFLVTYFKK